MADMNVSITPELEAMVQDLVRSGRYTSASEVVREALRLFDDHRRARQSQLAAMHAQITASLDDVERGEIVEGADAMAHLRGRIGRSQGRQ